MKPKEYEGLVPKLREDFHPNEMPYPLEEHEIELLVLIDGKTSATALATLKRLTSAQVRKILSSLAAKEVIVLVPREMSEAVKVGAARHYMPKGPFQQESSAPTRLRRAVPSTFPRQTPAPPTLQRKTVGQQEYLIKSTPSVPFRTPQIREIQHAHAQAVPAPGHTTHLAFSPKTSTKPARFVPFKHTPSSTDVETKVVEAQTVEAQVAKAQTEQSSTPTPIPHPKTLSAAAFAASTPPPETNEHTVASFATNATNPSLRSLREELLGDVLSMDDGQHVNRVFVALAQAINCLRSAQSNPPMLQQALSQLHQSLTQFFETKPRLTIQVRPFELVCDNRVTYRNQDQDANLAYLLYNDGIRAISFQSDLCRQELAQFLLILVSQDQPHTHPTDNFATLFWDAAFQTIDILSLDEISRLHQPNEMPATKAKTMLAALWEAESKADKIASPPQQEAYNTEDVHALIQQLSPTKVHFQPIATSSLHALWEEESQESASASADRLLDFLVQALRQPAPILSAEVIRRLQSDAQRQKVSKQNQQELVEGLKWLLEQPSQRPSQLRYEQRYLQLLTDLSDAPNRKEIIETQRLIGGPKPLLEIHCVLQKAIAASYLAYQQGQMVDLTPLRHALHPLVDMLYQDPIEGSLYELMLLAASSPPQVAHAQQLTILAVLIGVESGFSKKWLSELAITSSLHFVGCTPETPYPETRSQYGAMLFAKSTREWTDATIKICLALAEHQLPQASQKQLRLFGRIMQIADIYCHLTKPLTSTPPVSPAVALQLLWSGRGTHFDASLLQALTNRLGMYPPGTLVALQDQRVGVSLGHRGGPQSFARPVLWLVGNKDGQQCSGPILDLAYPEHAHCQIHNALKTNEKANQYVKRTILRAMGQRIHGEDAPGAS